jgi:hypothetical protein
MKAPVRSTPTVDVLLKIWPCVDQLCIGIFQPPLPIGIVKRCPFGKDIADGGIDRATEKAMSFVEAGDDFRSHPAYERKGAWGVCTFQLHPAPRSEAEIVPAWQAVPDYHGRET